MFQRGSIWWIQFSNAGSRWRESSKSTSRADAEGLLSRRLEELASGKLGRPHRSQPLLYMIRAAESRRVKIGISVRPKERLATLKTGSPEQLSIVRTYAMNDVERAIHKLLSDHRLHGEWFGPGAEGALVAMLT